MSQLPTDDEMRADAMNAREAVAKERDELQREVDHLRAYAVYADRERDALAVQCEALLEALKKAHACATRDENGNCKGCFVSEAVDLTSTRAAEIARKRSECVEELNEVLASIGQCGTQEAARGYCSHGGALRRLPCPFAAAREKLAELRKIEGA